MKRDVMKEEMEFLLKNRLTEPNMSPYASPCLLVP